MTIEHNAFYDDRTVFYLDSTRLCPGDIILTRNRTDDSTKGRMKSSVIAAAGKSNFSHALICSQPPTMIEAIGPGVSTLSIIRVFYHEERDVRVLRYIDPVISRRASAKAGMFLGKGYSVRMAIQSVLPVAADAEEPMVSTFCSALISAAYRKSGAPEFQSINPYRTTPGDLARMDFLKDVTLEVSRPMLAPQNIEEMTALDGVRHPSPFDGQAKVLFALHASVADDVEAFFRQWELELEIPTSFFETLEFLVHALKWATDGNDPLKKEYASALRLIDQKLAYEFDKGDLQQMFKEADERDTKTLLSDLQESFEPFPDIDINATRSLLETTAHQISSRSWVLEAENRAAGLSLAWDRWCIFSASTIEAFKNRQMTLNRILSRIDPLHSSNNRASSISTKP